MTGPSAPTVALTLGDPAGIGPELIAKLHDRGQIALKLMGFDRGVTVQGGLPVPVTTPPHGTAFDIAGQNKAGVEALSRAFAIACRMEGSAARAFEGLDP